MVVFFLFFISFFTSIELGLGFPRRTGRRMGPSRGCRREGCIQQVKGEDGAHSYTGHWRRRQSFEHKELNSHHLVQGYKMGGVAVEVGAPDAA